MSKKEQSDGEVLYSNIKNVRIIVVKCILIQVTVPRSSTLKRKDFTQFQVDFISTVKQNFSFTTHVII